MDVTALGEVLFEKLRPHLRLTENKKNVLIFHNKQLSLQLLQAHIMEASLEAKVNLPFNDELIAQLRQFFIQKFLEARPSTLTDEYKDFQIGLDILTGLRHVIKDGGLQPFDFNLWRERVPEEQYELLNAMAVDMVAAFNPHKPLSWEDRVQTTTGYMTLPHYNTYVPAPWTLIEPPTDYTTVENFIPDFLEHFAPVKEERDYLKWWLCNLTRSRCQDVLTFCGTQGNGKNTFMNLASLIAGQHNTITASKAFGKDKFNSEVYRRKLVNLDEYALKDSAKDAIKCWCNDLITVEAKKADPQPMQNHCSFILANNYVKNISLEYKDRRFTVPELATTDILNVWGAERVRTLQDLITKDEDFQLKFPHWIRKTVEEEGIDFGNATHLKTPRFYYIAEKSKPRWVATFKRLLKAQDSVSAQDVYKQTRVRVSDDAIMDRLDMEHEERRERGMEPTEIARVSEDEGQVCFESLIFDEEETQDEGNKEPVSRDIKEVAL
jgi:hypothetical protein